MLSSGFTVDSNWPLDQSGAPAPCALVLRVNMPQGEPSGRVDVATLSATLAYVNDPGVTVSSSVTDTTTVAVGGQLELQKRVRNVTQGTPLTTLGTGRPGEVLEYCINYQNLGASPVTQTEFRDPVPFFTTFETSAYVGQDIKWTVGGTTTPLTAAPDSDVGELSAGVIEVDLGTVAPGTSGQVCYQARIQ